MGRSGLIFKTFTCKGCKIATQKKVCFWAYFARIRRLYSKDPKVIQQGSGGIQQGSGGYFFLPAGFLCIGATIYIGQEMLCLPNAQFFKLNAPYFGSKEFCGFIWICKHQISPKVSLSICFFRCFTEIYNF